jgi:hypothetical protein
MGIMETIPEGYAWVSSHFDLFMYGEEGSIVFGDGKFEYSMPYYDMFEHEGVPIDCYDGITFISKFKQWIDDGYYIVADINNLKVLDPQTLDVHYHEICLIGYDEKKRVFFFPGRYDNSSNFEQMEISYDALLLAFDSIREYYRSSPEIKFSRVFSFFLSCNKNED